MPHAVVTGATQGIGRAITEKLLSQGFSVAVCARSTADLKLAEAEWNGKYPTASILAFPADMSNKEEVKTFATAVLANFPAIDILVNNAGTYAPGNLADEPEGQLEEIMDVNLFSAYHLTRALLPTMKKQGNGHIFNMCSIASLKAYPNGGAYSISKYALLGFSDNLRHELMPDNIKVTSICPGATYTRSWASTGLPEERFMKSEDIAEVLWTSYNLSAGADMETIILRPLKGDL